MDTHIKFIKREKVFRFFEKQTEIDILSKIKDQNLLLSGFKKHNGSKSDFLFSHIINQLNDNKKIILFLYKENEFLNFFNNENYKQVYLKNKTIKIINENDIISKNIPRLNSDINIFILNELTPLHQYVDEVINFIPHILDEIAINNNNSVIIFEEQWYMRYFDSEFLSFIENANKNNNYIIISIFDLMLVKQFFHVFDNLITGYTIDPYAFGEHPILKSLSKYSDGKHYNLYKHTLLYSGIEPKFKRLEPIEEFNNFHFLFYKTSTNELLTNMSAHFKHIKY